MLAPMGRPARFVARSIPGSLDRPRRTMLGLLWLASLPAAFANTVFTQTAAFAAREFGVSAQEQGVAAAIVRAGVVITIPIALLADRVGRRRVIVALSWGAPLVVGLGALAPSFGWLVASQFVGRPLGIALTVVVIVVATEEMGSDARAWALGVLAIGSGFGAGTAVATLPLAGIDEGSWRLVYVVGLAWLVVAAILTSRLAETGRFLTHAATRTIERVSSSGGRVQPRRLALQALVAASANVFIASVSVFQVRYLLDVREFGAAATSVFLIATTIPASIGLVVGGRIADHRGRRALAGVAIPLATAASVAFFSVSGVAMWLAAVVGATAFAFAYPAMAVFRSELFPTARRTLSSSLVTTSSLLGGAVGLVAVGVLVDRGVGYGVAIGAFAPGPLLVALLIATRFPETALRELEELNAD